jgi:NADH-quinone oxidoreductase subunit A
MLNSQIINGYLPVVLLIGIALSLGILIVLVPIVTGMRRSYVAKNSQYECGFKGFGSARKKFDVRFYLISMLFIVFDIEIAFLFPWAIVLKQIGLAGFISMMIFISVLAVGFIYEWKKGALEI